MILTFVLAAILSISFADGAIPIFASEQGPADGTYPVYHFSQLIDHNNPGRGTFQQRFWASSEFYENGGPVILMTPGEINAETYTDYLTNLSINGMIAQQEHGATVILEHRFFGESNPYNNLTSQSLEFLTVKQAIDDLVYFAKNVHLPILGGDKVKPDTTPWVLVGASYAGALTAWTMESNPGVFRAGYASSATVEAITDFYNYWTPIREYMPQNCSSDVQAVIAYLDKTYAENDTAAMHNLKDAFGLAGLSHIDDFAYALQTDLATWQNLAPATGPGATFFQFCDALEVKGGVNAPATGWGLEHAIDAWGSFWNNTFQCPSTDVSTCLGSYDASAPRWTDVSVNNPLRSWMWMLCNELGRFTAGPPLGQPAIVSRIVQPIYWERVCVYMFPQKFSHPPSPSTAEINKKYKGWNINVDRLFFANGLRDPWRDATVSAEGLRKANTTTQPIYVSDAYHASDMAAANGMVDETVHTVQVAALGYMRQWLAGFVPSTGINYGLEGPAIFHVPSQ